MNNRLHNCKNPYQGQFKKVLAVCSAGLLRSPTIANVLHKEYGYNTRSCGIHDYALVMCDDVLLTWADEIVVVDLEKEYFIKEQLQRLNLEKPVINLNIPDIHEFMDPDLQNDILIKYKK